MVVIIVLDEDSFDLFRYLLLGDQLIPWEPHPLVSHTSKVNLKLFWNLVHDLGEGLHHVTRQYIQLPITQYQR